MIGSAARFALTLAAAGAGAALGESLGVRWHEGPAGGVIGAALAVTLLSAVDAWRGMRLRQWLAGPRDAPVPLLGSGFWGDTAARIDRGFRLRERETRTQLERHEQFLAGIEASPNGVLLLDARSQIAWCNGAAAAHLGLDPVRDIQQPITNLVRSPQFVSFMQAGDFSQPVRFVSQMTRAVLQLIVRPYGDGQSLLLTQDVTERERNDAMRRDFAANVSHEMRTPLTVLSGFLETLGTLDPSPAERDRMIELMQQQSHRMESLVADLLALAQLEGSPQPPLDEWVPMALIAAAVQPQALGLSGEQHGFEFDWGEAVSVAGSEAELVSAVGNLVNNAVRYTPPGGKVSVRVCSQADGTLHITVADTGPGIAAEHLPRLTERFYRVDRSRSRDTGGTGLGLSIVKHVAQRHGGELMIASDLGKGSSFTIRLPALRVRVGR